MYILTEHNMINKLINIESITRSLVYNCVTSIDNMTGLPANTKMVIVGGKCFDLAINKNILEYLNFQHEENKKITNMSNILYNTNLKDYLTSSDIDVHLITPTILNNGQFIQLIRKINSVINKYIQTNNLDYLNSVIKKHNIKTIIEGDNLVKTSYPKVKYLENLQIARLYIDFEFIDEIDKKQLRGLTVIDPSQYSNMNIRILTDSKVRLYIFDIVVETHHAITDGFINTINSDFISNRAIQLPGYSIFHVINSYDMFNQIFHLINNKAKKLTRNIIRFTLAFIFYKNHYLSPIGVKMTINEYNRLNTFFINLIKSGKLNRLLNSIELNIKMEKPISLKFNHLTCTTCNNKFYEDMMYSKYDKNFNCCPSDNEKVRQHRLDHGLDQPKVHNITVFNYYGFNIGESEGESEGEIRELLYNRKNIQNTDLYINNTYNYTKLREYFNKTNQIIYSHKYTYNIRMINENYNIISNYILPNELINICSKTTLNTFIATFLLIEGNLINENLYQSYDSFDYDTSLANNTIPILQNKLKTDYPKLNNTIYKMLIHQVDKHLTRYINAESPKYNVKCRDLFVLESDKRDQFFDVSRDRRSYDDVEQLQQGILLRRCLNYKVYNHNMHNSFIVYSGQFLPITYNSEGKTYNTVDELEIGNEIYYNSFNSTSCRFQTSYRWVDTDLCYIIRFNGNNENSKNSIFTIVQLTPAEMEILFGFGNRFTVIDKCMVHNVKSNLLNKIDLNIDINDCFKLTKQIIKGLNKEKKLIFLDCNGSYLNDKRSRVISSQIISFLSYINGYENIGISKQIPTIIDKKSDKIKDDLHNRIDNFMNRFNNENLGSSWNEYFKYNSTFGQNFLNNQLRFSRISDGSTIHKIVHGLNLGSNESKISIVLSEAVSKNILYCFPVIYDFFYTKEYNCYNRIKIKDSSEIGVPNDIDIYLSTIIMKEYSKLNKQGDVLNGDFYPIDIISNVNLLNDHLLLASYGLRYSLYVAYTKYGFAHGDIANGRDNNLMLDYDIIDPNIYFILFKTKIGNKMYRFSYYLSDRYNIIPKIVLIDFGTSNMKYKDDDMIISSIGGTNSTYVEDSLPKLKHDLFHSTGSNSFNLSKLLNIQMLPTLTEKMIHTNSDVDKLITIIENINKDTLPYFIKTSVDNLDITDEMKYKEWYPDLLYDHNQIMIYSNDNDINDIMFDKMIKNMTENKV
jgi:hypothetical protein